MSDLYASNVVFLANFNGTAGDTTYTAETGDVATFGGTANLSASSKFGTTALLCNATGEYVSFNTTLSTLAFLHSGEEDYTIEGFVNIQEAPLSGTQTIFDTKGNAVYGVTITAANSGSGRLNFALRGDDAFTTVLGDASSIAGFSYHYFAVTFEASTGDIEVYTGTSGSTSNIGSDTISNSGTVNDPDLFWVGNRTTDTAQHTNGLIDSIRITKGIIRDVSTVPTAEFDLAQAFNADILMAGPLGAPSINTYSDYATVLESIDDGNGPDGPGGARPEYLASMTGTTPLEVSIGSWQATRQTGRAQYCQCVLKGAQTQTIADYVGETLTIYRVDTIGGTEVRTSMVEVPIDTVRTYQGVSSLSYVLAGYAATVSAPTVPQTKTLRNVRTKAIGSDGKSTMRASIDYFLRPGDTVQYDGDSFTADYVNYYVTITGNNFRSYMDVGSR